MAHEVVKIMKRRFLSRILESGLLILAVALGVGASTVGLSLFIHTYQYNRELLLSPAYRELIITTHDNMEDLERAAVENHKTENIVLTSADLNAAEIVPQISYAYVSIKSQIGFLTEELVKEKGISAEQAQTVENDKEVDELTRSFFNMVETFREAGEKGGFIIPEINELSGYKVSPQFFDAWNMETVAGSLFTSSDMLSQRGYIVLGSNAADLIKGEDDSIESLVGKKIISYFNYYTIIGILKPTQSDYDNLYFAPDTILSGEARIDLPKQSMNRQLRFTVTKTEELNEAAGLLKNWFENAYGRGQIAISNPREEAERIIKRNRGVSILILFLSLAGFFITLINVTNIFLSRSLKMKKHVGILKALGATNKSVMALFTGEAFFVTLIGSVIGLCLAFPLVKVMENSLNLGSGAWLNVFYSTLISSFFTFLFSTLPSWQNSR